MFLLKSLKIIHVNVFAFCSLQQLRGLFSLPGLRRLESCSHSRQRCETCLDRSLSQLTVRRAQKTMTRSCSDNTNSQHHNRSLAIYNLHNNHHNPSARVHSLDTAKVTKNTPQALSPGDRTFTCLTKQCVYSQTTGRILKFFECFSV